MKEKKENALIILKAIEKLNKLSDDPLMKEEVDKKGLSWVLTEILYDMNINQVVSTLTFLGNKDFDNYDIQFLSRLYSKYTLNNSNELLLLSDSDFLRFAKAWPNFLRNETMTERLLKMGKETLLIDTLDEIMTILGNKRIYNKDLCSKYCKLTFSLKN